MRTLKIFCIPVLLLGCGVESSSPSEARSEAVIQSVAPPTLGPGAYALPLIDGWQTLSVSHSFDVNNNALGISGGATGNGGGGGGYWYMPVPLGVGQGLAAVGLTVRDTAGAPILAYIDVRDTLTNTTTNWCQGASNGTGLIHGFAFSCPGTMPASAQMVLRITPQGQPGTVYGAWVQPSGVNTITLAASAFVAEDPAHPISYVFSTALAADFAARASVPVPVGRRIVAARATIVDSAGDHDAVMSLQLISLNSNNANVIASSPVSAGNGSQQVLSIAPATTVLPHTAYQLRVYAQGVPSSQDALWFAEVDYN